MLVSGRVIIVGDPGVMFMFAGCLLFKHWFLFFQRRWMPTKLPHFQMGFWVFNLVLAMQVIYSHYTVQRSLREYKDPIWRYLIIWPWFASQLMPLGQRFRLDGLLLVFRETSLETWYVPLNSFVFKSKPQEKLPVMTRRTTNILWSTGTMSWASYMDVTYG